MKTPHATPDPASSNASSADQGHRPDIGLIIVGDEILSGKRADKHMPKVIELLADPPAVTGYGSWAIFHDSTTALSGQVVGGVVVAAGTERAQRRGKIAEEDQPGPATCTRQSLAQYVVSRMNSVSTQTKSDFARRLQRSASASEVVMSL